MSSPSPEELTKAIEELRKKVDALSTPLEDALSHRVFQKSLEQFKKWVSGWLAVVAVGLLFFGYKGYDEIVSAGRKEASTYIKDKALVQLQNDVKSEFAEVQKQLKQSALKEATKLETELAELLFNTQFRVDEGLKKVATQLVPVVKDPQFATRFTEKRPEKLFKSAYAYYGIASGNNTWNERFFKRTSGDAAELPKTGDTVEATAPVNAREGVIEFTGGGWVNKKMIGLIKPGTLLKVLDVVPVAGSFIWIKFDQLSP